MHFHQFCKFAKNHARTVLTTQEIPNKLMAEYVAVAKWVSQQPI